MDKEKVREKSMGERREGDKNTKGITKERAMIFPIFFSCSYVVYNNVHVKIKKYSWGSGQNIWWLCGDCSYILSLRNE
jgi:hypothetical protein